MTFIMEIFFFNRPHILLIKLNRPQQYYIKYFHPNSKDRNNDRCVGLQRSVSQMIDKY